MLCIIPAEAALYNDVQKAFIDIDVDRTLKRLYFPAFALLFWIILHYFAYLSRINIYFLCIQSTRMNAMFQTLWSGYGVRYCYDWIATWVIVAQIFFFKQISLHMNLSKDYPSGQSTQFYTHLIHVSKIESQHFIFSGNRRIIVTSHCCIANTID